MISEKEARKIIAEYMLLVDAFDDNLDAMPTQVMKALLRFNKIILTLAIIAQMEKEKETK